MEEKTMIEGAPSFPLLIGGEPIETNEWLDVMNPAVPNQCVVGQMDFPEG